MSSTPEQQPGIRDLARQLGVNPGSVARWLRRGMPRDIDGAMAWRQLHARQRVKPAASAERSEAATGETFSNWRTRRERAAALQAELELRKTAGELVNAKDVERELATRVVAVREAALSAAARLSAVLVHQSDQAEVHRLIDDEMRAWLELLAGREAEAMRD